MMATRPALTTSAIGSRHVQRALLAAIVGAMVVPVVLDADDFPLSTYPMYSSARPAETSFVTAVAVRPDGDVERLGLDLIGGSDDPLIVAGELRAAIRAGQADARCAAIADRLRSDRRDDGMSGWRIEVITEQHDVVSFVSSTDSLIGRSVHATCMVAENG